MEHFYLADVGERWVEKSGVVDSTVGFCSERPRGGGEYRRQRDKFRPRRYEEMEIERMYEQVNARSWALVGRSRAVAPQWKRIVSFDKLR